MTSNKVERLIVKYLNRSISEDELLILERALLKKSNRILLKEMVEINYLSTTKEINHDNEIQNILRKIKRKKSQSINKRTYYLKYAAVFITFLGLGYLYFDSSSNSEKTSNEHMVQQPEILPGSDKAILTLGDGSEISLVKGHDYESINSKSNGEEIVYNPNPSVDKLSYNYLTVPRGGQFTLQLADGTKVWLNSDSKLRYPVTFISGQDRTVDLIYGEAYFDVSPSSKHLGAGFKVVNNQQEVDVLGTEFNIKAYKDEVNTYTTLVEGKVTINYSGKNIRLKPNQQSIIDSKNNALVKTVDVYNEVSWKDGVFSFENKTLNEIMKVLARWYDVEVVFKNEQVEKELFFGVLDKEQDIEDILMSIKNFGIIKSYEIENKRIQLE
jgi:ferric-dicitrate binding protein FerR (iron transport regulator)